MYKNGFHLFLCAILLLTPVLFVSCGTEPEVVTQPGILRVVLQADPTDTSIEILGQTTTVGDDDSLGVSIFQGKAIALDDRFAILFKDVETATQEQCDFNLLSRPDGEFERHVIFESFAPAGDYKGISIGIEGIHMSIGAFEIPVELPADDDAIMVFLGNYRVLERQVTEVTIQLKAFESMSRFLDSFVFDRVAAISEIKVLPESEFNELVKDLPPLVNPNIPYQP